MIAWELIENDGEDMPVYEYRKDDRQYVKLKKWQIKLLNTLLEYLKKADLAIKKECKKIK